MMATDVSRALWTMAVVVVALTAVLTGSALSQTASPALGLREQPQPPPQQAPASEPAPRSNPGLVEELGKLFEKMSIVPLKSPGEARVEPPAGAPGDTMVGAPGAPAEQPPRPADQPLATKNGGDSGKGVLKETGETLSRLATPSSMISGRSVCPVANGTPDCKLGADRLCQSKGYKDGKSLNTDSAETCSAKVLIPGRQRKPDDCRTDTFVTSALCQ
jgi:hypothetical protein